MDNRPIIVWFRNDLRIEDNPALHAARETGRPVLGIYILDETLDQAPGAASRWWLHHSLTSLAGDLKKAGTRLILRRGKAQKVISELVAQTHAAGLYWNRRYFCPHMEIDRALKTDLEGQGLDMRSFNAALLREPWETQTGSGGHYRVFTPFWKKLRELGPSRNEALPRMRKIEGPKKAPSSDSLSSWSLRPEKPNWASGLEPLWTPGERGGRRRLRVFIDEAIVNYSKGRNLPAKEFTSRLSPHLAFGEISPLVIWQNIETAVELGEINRSEGENFLSELAWRDFSYNLLYHYPNMPDQPLRPEFANYPWRDDKNGLKAWRRGETGYPIVDAGMKQLWRTGWMHNRVRMIVASFLIKDLLIDWRQGEAWFWDTLVDADLANNSASWQWTAGCGADAAPYFRIFNPISQGEKFDPDGDYVREFLPVLADLPAKFIHAPWTAPEEILQKAGLSLGKDYPKPIVDHSKARARALKGYDKIKGD